MTVAAILLFANVPRMAHAQNVSDSCHEPEAGESKPWLNNRYSPKCRAKYVLGQLKTLDDKFTFLASSGFNPGIDQRDIMSELGLKRGGGSDGPAGIARGTGVTAFPTPLLLAATFDPAMAIRYGDLLGQEFFDAGLNGITGPAIDMARTWHFGRITESFG